MAMKPRAMKRGGKTGTKKMMRGGMVGMKAGGSVSADMVSPRKAMAMGMKPVGDKKGKK